MTTSQTEINSVASSFSQISMHGETVDAEAAVDDSVKKIQEALNEINVCLRNLLMEDERSGEYEHMIDHANHIKELCSDGVHLYKDILSITKQLLPKKPKDYVAPVPM
jgi:hypothetical protein